MSEPGGGIDVAEVAEWVRRWVLPLFAPAAIGGFVWVGRKMQTMDSALEKLNKHEGELEVIKSKQIATDLRVAELPSRTEMTAIVQAAVSQIGQMIAVRYHREPSAEDFEATMKRYVERYMGALHQEPAADIDGD